MEHVSKVIATRKAQLDNAKARLAAAESSVRDGEIKLRERRKEEEILQKKIELAKQYNQASKELLLVLQKLDGSKKRLAIVEDRSKRAESIVQSLLSQAEEFELKYRETKKNYNDLLYDLSSMGLN
ncbi:hypothetical protein CPB83DRAFT_848608 [Crepidotus variabilis]|uniref:Uncharacterized protein n=1 Tax=Crepidotus variabilis TaxID=179855 RepID=A0A9P6EMV7_9AGAR|nr:hypothetical protein CPB83DRAFT_848608 [Crepidotus variabilis]